MNNKGHVFRHNISRKQNAVNVIKAKAQDSTGKYFANVDQEAEMYVCKELYRKSNFGIVFFIRIYYCEAWLATNE